MIVIPSVDIKDGRCVKLIQGKPGTGLDVSSDPIAVAKHWQSEGAEMLHVVDLDGAISGSRRNRGLIQSLVAAVAIPVQVGGGIRTVEDAISLLRSAANPSGASRIIIGTALSRDPMFIRELANRGVDLDRVFISLDAREKVVLKEGWTADTGWSLTEWASSLRALAIGGLVYTDVSVEGTLRGPNLKAARQLVATTGLPIIYAGGISSLDDLRQLSGVGVEGAVVGMALYQARFTLKEAQEACRRAKS